MAFRRIGCGMGRRSGLALGVLISVALSAGVACGGSHRANVRQCRALSLRRERIPFAVWPEPTCAIAALRSMGAWPRTGVATRSVRGRSPSSDQTIRAVVVFIARCGTRDKKPLPAQKVLVLVSSGATATVAVHLPERHRFALLYDPSQFGRRSHRVSDGEWKVTFHACRWHETDKLKPAFNGGFIVAGPGCLSVDVLVKRKVSGVRDSFFRSVSGAADSFPGCSSRGGFADDREWTKSTYSTKTTSGAIVRSTMATKELLNVRDTARALGVHENTVRNWEARGLLRAVHLPGSGFRRFAPQDVERLRARDVRAARAGDRGSRREPRPQAQRSTRLRRRDRVARTRDRPGPPIGWRADAAETRTAFRRRVLRARSRRALQPGRPVPRRSARVSAAGRRARRRRGRAAAADAS